MTKFADFFPSAVAWSKEKGRSGNRIEFKKNDRANYPLFLYSTTNVDFSPLFIVKEKKTD